MTVSLRRCVCHALLVTLVGASAVVSAPSIDTNADRDDQKRPDLSGFVDWSSVRDKTICPAQVAFNPHLRVLQVWCADGVEGQTFEARGQQYVCRSLRYTIHDGTSDINVLGGCVARLDETAAKDDSAAKDDAEE